MIINSLPSETGEIFFFLCGNVTKRYQVRVRDKYNMWKN